MVGRAFDSPGSARTYAARMARAVPGVEIVHRIVDQVLSETVPIDGRVLVVGAGGGMELAHLAASHPGWIFDGVDPSEPMLQAARDRLGALLPRVALWRGGVDRAPAGPFDGATCLLVLHFLTGPQRADLLSQVRRRLRPGAPLLTIHHCAPEGAQRLRWLERYARLTADDPQTAATSAATLAERLTILSPDQERQMLERAGFVEVQPFYAALTLHGWLARVPDRP